MIYKSEPICMVGITCLYIDTIFSFYWCIDLFNLLFVFVFFYPFLLKS